MAAIIGRFSLEFATKQYFLCFSRKKCCYRLEREHEKKCIEGKAFEFKRHAKPSYYFIISIQLLST